MITAAEVRRFIAELGKTPRVDRHKLARVLGDIVPRGERVEGGVRALELRASSAIGDKS
ncbi:MAG: hypothetical protein ACAI38_25115 [Myxococcota bacterium]|nr:hypothetical protein [Myxococcota bacterium]